MSNTKKQKYAGSAKASLQGSKKARISKADFSSGGWDDDVDSDADAFSGDDAGGNSSGDESIDARESAEQKRRRLAKEYLASMEADESASSDDSEEEDGNGNTGGRTQAISSRLRKERLDAKGRYFRNLSGAVEANEAEIADAPHVTVGGFDLAVTCVALSSDETFVIAGSKDNSVVRIDVETQQKQVLKAKWRRNTHEVKQSSEGEILSVAISTDGRYTVSGGRDSKIRIFDARAANAEVKVLTGHRGAVTSLAFRRESYSLFSGSLDRCLKHWDLSEMGYLETLFGHQDAVTAVDCWTQERPVSTSTDRTSRMWKVSDESHLVFRGHKSSADAVQLLTDDTFITGGQDGALNVWKESQKKPVATAAAAHGWESANNPNWISGLATTKMSNIAASGSCDGYVRLWNASAETRELNQVAEIPVGGFVNSIAVSPRMLVCGTGREHRWGRWWCQKGNKNKVVIMKFPVDLDQCTPEDGEAEQFDESSSDDDVSGSDSDNDEDEQSGEEESD